MAHGQIAAARSLHTVATAMRPIVDLALEKAHGELHPCQHRAADQSLYLTCSDGGPALAAFELARGSWASGSHLIPADTQFCLRVRPRYLIACNFRGRPKAEALMVAAQSRRSPASRKSVGEIRRRQSENLVVSKAPLADLSRPTAAFAATFAVDLTVD